MPTIYGVDPVPDPRCWCCESLLTTKGDCPVCDWASLMSPPHACLKRGETISDEDGCGPDFGSLPHDHEAGPSVALDDGFPPLPADHESDWRHPEA